LTSTSEDIARAWRRFLQDYELARHYKLPYTLHSEGPLNRNPVLERLLPALLHVKLVGLLDEALMHLVESKGLVLPTKHGALGARLLFLDGQGILSDFDKLKLIKDRRNDLAHESNAWTSWEQLEADISTVDAELQHFGYVGRRPTYEYFGERSAVRGSLLPGVLWEREYRFGLKQDGREIVAFSSVERIMKDSE